MRNAARDSSTKSAIQAKIEEVIGDSVRRTAHNMEADDSDVAG